LLAKEPLYAGTRGGVTTRNVRPVLFPTQQDLGHAIFGAAIPTQVTPQQEPVVLKLTVTHTNLENARYPLAIGHYDGDVFAGAEWVLDARLDNKLSKRRAMNLYPGPEGTVEVILAPEMQPPGALVIGLGEIGQLTADIVTRGVTEAALRLALVTLEQQQKRASQTKGEEAETNAPPGPLSVQMSSLLIGRRGGRSLSIESAITAITTGVIEANRLLRDNKLSDAVRLTEIQFVEIHEDFAIRAAHTLRDLRSHLRLALMDDELLDIYPYLIRGEGGYVNQPASEYATGWWRRLQVTVPKSTAPRPTAPGAGQGDGGQHDDADDSGGALQFVLLTDRARAEQTLQATQRALVEQLVAQTIDRTTTDLDIPATLYELLLPNGLKNQPLESNNLLLVLDPQAAHYPWGMMAERQVRQGEQAPTLRPLAVRMGMLRQLTTASYRSQVVSPRTKNALVIGEPRLDDPNYPPLPG
ncbi:MAG: hypothetical protein KDE53_13045, partial [Caldilineaceae bacterium]|nr:hypothetical protein [Caldilineaceae bacterium]